MTSMRPAALRFAFLASVLAVVTAVRGDDGYRLWLRYDVNRRRVWEVWTKVWEVGLESAGASRA
jgi:ABC-type ATPase with predicted acetyltransferase domain